MFESRTTNRDERILEGAAIGDPSIAKCLSCIPVKGAAADRARIQVTSDLRDATNEYATVRTVVEVLKENGFQNVQLSYCEGSTIANRTLLGETVHESVLPAAWEQLRDHQDTVISAKSYVDVGVPWQKPQLELAKQKLESVCRQIEARAVELRSTPVSTEHLAPNS